MRGPLAKRISAGTQQIAVAAMVAVTLGCGDDPQHQDRLSDEDGSVAWVKGSGECYWELANPNGSTRLSAWVLADLDLNTGAALAFADAGKFPEVPIGDDLDFRLVADGDPTRSSATRGYHPDGQGAYMLSAMLGQPQRLAISGADEISIEYEGQIVATVTAEGFPTIKELSACDRE